MKTMTTPPSTKLYKVIFEKLDTNEEFIVVIEATSAAIAGDLVLDKAGPAYDLIMVVGARKSDLQ